MGELGIGSQRKGAESEEIGMENMRDRSGKWERRVQTVGENWVGSGRAKSKRRATELGEEEWEVKQRGWKCGNT